MPAGELEALKLRIRRFAQRRDWEQFHSPKNLAMALGGEVGELLELFQWLTEQQSKKLPPVVLKAVAREIADIQIYLLRLVDVLGIDLISAVSSKVRENARRYPVAIVRGSAKKRARRSH